MVRVKMPVWVEGCGTVFKTITQLPNLNRLLCLNLNQKTFSIYIKLKISASPSVIAILCSKWAERFPSEVTTVQPS